MHRLFFHRHLRNYLSSWNLECINIQCLSSTVMTQLKKCVLKSVCSHLFFSEEKDIPINHKLYQLIKKYCITFLCCDPCSPSHFWGKKHMEMGGRRLFFFPRCSLEDHFEYQVLFFHCIGSKFRSKLDFASMMTDVHKYSWVNTWHWLLSISCVAITVVVAVDHNNSFEFMRLFIHFKIYMKWY